PLPERPSSPTRRSSDLDTHFGTEQPHVVHALEEHVRAHGADLLIVSGDITQRARAGQFAAAQEFVERLKTLGIPQTLAIPGNHRSEEHTSELQSRENLV